ncbi:MAG TPA: lipopolysaccharide heptosyltransferase I, partial [Thermoanaerobaculia bacterium]|nr:lipopolysaccharide heptosyltransferase I [Thermoanaerobaculia bacterium]
MRLLIVRLSSFGDVLHALPIAANAKRAGAEVGWLVEPAYSGLLEADPDIDRVFVADTKGWRRSPLSPGTAAAIGGLRRALRAFAPDRTLEAQGLWKSALLAKAAGAPVIGFASGERKEP